MRDCAWPHGMDRSTALACLLRLSFEMYGLFWQYYGTARACAPPTCTNVCCSPAASGGPELPVLAPFSLQDNTALAFDGPATTVTTSGLNVTFTFKTNRPSLVYYRLVINVNQVRCR